MLSFLKNHPFAVDAFFKSSLVLTYAAPKEEVQKLLPACLIPDTWRDTWAFVAAAMVNTKDLRPAGFPRWMGNDFFLTGYRIFVRYTNRAGKTLRGLYILQSETDSRLMTILGNLFSHYRYSHTDISLTEAGPHIGIRSQASAIAIEINASATAPVPLPPGSPFADWKEARRFAGPLPFTFSHSGGRTIIIEGVRENWTPRPVKVMKADIGFISRLDLSHTVLANAFLVQNIPYHWKKGKSE